MKQMWGWFTDLSIFISGLKGLYVIFRTIKYVIALHLYQTVGGGIALLEGLWNTPTMWVIHRHQRGSAQAPLTEIVCMEKNEVVATDIQCNSDQGAQVQQSQFISSNSMSRRSSDNKCEAYPDSLRTVRQRQPQD